MLIERRFSGGECKEGVECYGGVARLATAVDRIRNKAQGHVLLLDAGDQCQGSPWYVAYKGSAAAHFMKRLDYDAMAIGNHEFDNGHPNG